MNSFFRKLRWLTRRSDKEAELREELQFHLEEEAEQRQEEGLAKDEARWAARRELGNLALVEENTRAAWGWTRLEQLARDAGYGLRQVRRNPAFSAIAIATLALGIGGITAMFSAFDAVLIRPLPYADADRLVMIWDDMTGERRSGKRSHARRMAGVAAPQYGLHRHRGHSAGRRPHCPAMPSPNRFRRARRRRISGAYLA